MRKPSCLLPLLALVLLPQVLPALTFEKTEIEYKAKPSDDEFTVAFPFTNKTDKPVKITRIESNCGCLSAKSDKDTYEPQESGTVTAVFSIGSFEGAQAKSVEVVTDGTAPGNKTNLTVSLTVPTIIKIEPKLARWTVGGPNTPRKVKVSMLYDEPIEVKKVTSTRPNVKVELVELKKGKEYEITLTPNDTGTPMLGMVTIVTDCPVKKHQKKLAFFSVQRARKTDRN